MAEKEREVEQMRQRLGPFFIRFDSSGHISLYLAASDPKIRLLDEKNKIEQDRAEQEKLMADKEAELKLHEAKIAQVVTFIFKAFKILSPLFSFNLDISLDIFYSYRLYDLFEPFLW